jgi:hypothetical protein
LPAAALALVASLAVHAAPGTAAAQYVPYGPFDVYSPTLFREGPGFKVLGDGLVIHPGFDAEIGYDSNILMNAGSSGAGVLRLRPHFDIATLPPQRLDQDARPKLVFRFGAAVEYRQYLSNTPGVDTARQFNASSDADLRIRPNDPLSLRLYNQFLVTNDARNLEVAYNGPTFAPRLYDRFGALATFRPRNGPLEIGLGDAFHVDHYIDSELTRMRSLANDIDLYGALRVLPQTTVKLTVRSSYVSYYGDGSVIPSSAPLRIIGGVQSLIWSWLGASLYLGYGNSLHSSPPATMSVYPPLVDSPSPIRYSGFVGGAELRLLLIQRMHLLVGWARDFYDSLFATFLVDDRLYVHYEHNLWRSLTARVGFDTYLRDYGRLVSPWELQYRAYLNDQRQRHDTLIGLSAEATYRPLAWLETGISYSLLDDITSFGYVDGAGNRIGADFVKHVLLLKVDIAY